MNKLRALVPFVLATMAWAALPARAATVTLCGPNICYDYRDDQAGMPFFGAPSLVGDSLRFFPVDFLASSGNPGEYDLLKAIFVVDRVYALSGQAIATIGVSEAGDYRTREGGGIAAGLYVLVSSNSVPVFDVAIDSVEVTTPSGGLAPWLLAASVDVIALGNNAARDVALLIQNSLEAFGGGPSFTQKKLILVDVAAVPGPATLPLLLTGILGGMLWRRRWA